MVKFRVELASSSNGGADDCLTVNGNFRFKSIINGVEQTCTVSELARRFHSSGGIMINHHDTWRNIDLITQISF